MKIVISLVVTPPKDRNLSQGSFVIDPSQRYRQQLPRKFVKVFLQTLGNQSHASAGQPLRTTKKMMNPTLQVLVDPWTVGKRGKK